MDAFNNRPDILDVTLRDGSYLIDFQFTARDTAVIASALESVGLRWIEVGHGVGLNASASGRGVAAATDEEYLEAASESLKVARWGMFFIPGIGREEDLRLAARYKMSFVRIGTNVTEAIDAERFLKQAKDLGMLVSYNAMKSYAVSPEKWGSIAAQVHEWGADIVCLVDSAGSMYPEEVATYLKEARGQSEVSLGFHGHDNLSLAMANTLRAIDEGAILVDSSLQGMGRSAGNAITEVLVAILRKRKLLPSIEMKGLMDVGAGLIRPLLGRRGIDPMAVTGGFASFHSSFTPKVVKYAQKHGVDVRDLIVRLCEQDLISAPDDLLERLGEELASAKVPKTLRISTFGAGKVGKLQGREALQATLSELRTRAAKSGKFSVLNAVIAEAPQNEITVSGNMQDTLAHVVGSVSYTTNHQLDRILRCVEANADVLLLDVDRKPFGPSTPATAAMEVLKKTILLTYLDSRVWVQAAEDQVVRLLGENLEGVPVVIAGDHHKSRLLAATLAERSAHVTLLSKASVVTAGPSNYSRPSGASGNLTNVEAESSEGGDRIEQARMVVVWPNSIAWFGKAEASRVSPETCVLDCGMGRFLSDAADEVWSRKGLLMRLNMWPTLAGTLVAAHETRRICQESMGRATLAGVPVVAGGAMGQRGDVIVDSIHEPSRVIGIADGRGAIMFQYSAEEADRVRRVTKEIESRIVMPHEPRVS